MIRKNKEQFDSGGVMLQHGFLLPFCYGNTLEGYDWKRHEEIVDKYIEEETQLFKWELKFRIMLSMKDTGVIIDNGVDEIRYKKENE